MKDAPLIDSIFGKDGHHIAFGAGVLLLLVALFALAMVGGFASTRIVCYAFMAAAFVDSIAIPRISPVKTTKYDESTPITSFILGNRTATLSTNYLLLEIVVAAVMLHFDFQRIMLAFYIQAGLMLVYLSFIAYLTSRPGTSERHGDVATETVDDVVPAHTTRRHVDDSKPIAHDRMDLLVKSLVATSPRVKDAELKREINKLVDALKKSPQDSFESMDDVEHMMAVLVGELGERIKRKELDMAKECVMLLFELSNQRAALYNQIMDKGRTSQKGRKSSGKKRR